MQIIFFEVRVLYQSREKWDVFLVTLGEIFKVSSIIISCSQVSFITVIFYNTCEEVF